mgnify:CR=1 FL=1
MHYIFPSWSWFVPKKYTLMSTKCASNGIEMAKNDPANGVKVHIWNKERFISLKYE